jgi:Sec-independent protein translocase protein TatA
MLAFLGNLGPTEIVLIVVIAVLIFGKNLPQAASKAYLQVRKLRDAVDDLRRETGIDRELRNIERSVREAEWELRREATGPQAVTRQALAAPHPAPAPESAPLAAIPPPAPADAPAAGKPPEQPA